MWVFILNACVQVSTVTILPNFESFLSEAALSFHREYEKCQVCRNYKHCCGFKVVLFDSMTLLLSFIESDTQTKCFLTITSD